MTVSDQRMTEFEQTRVRGCVDEKAAHRTPIHTKMHFDVIHSLDAIRSLQTDVTSGEGRHLLFDGTRSQSIDCAKVEREKVHCVVVQKLVFSFR